MSLVERLERCWNNIKRLEELLQFEVAFYVV